MVLEVKCIEWRGILKVGVLLVSDLSPALSTKINKIMSIGIKVLEEAIKSREMRVKLGVSVYPLVEEYKIELEDLKNDLHNLKMLNK